MSVFVIDGTNLIRRVYTGRRTSPAEEEDYARTFLEGLGWLAARYGSHSFRVVFDGAPRGLASGLPSGVDVYFGKEGGADRVVLDQARYLAASGRTVVVVTADRELQDLAAEEGAQSILPEEFLKRFKLAR